MRWRIAADTGGTFTDCLAAAPDGSRRILKLLSTGALRTAVVEVAGSGALRIADAWDTRESGSLLGFKVRAAGTSAPEGEVTDWDPARRLLTVAGATFAAGAAIDLFTGEEAPVAGARVLTGTPAGEPLPPIDFRLATTRGTNALLERRGAPTAFFVTAGFADLLEIGDQRRPDLFALRHRLPRPIPRWTVEAAERMAPDGAAVVPLDEDKLRRDAAAVLEAGAEAAAVAFAHSYRFPDHERRAGEILRELGFRHVSMSSEIAPLIKLLPRAQTAAADACLAPVMAEFVGRVDRALGRGGRLHLMTSAGGLEAPDVFRPKDSLLSGPAGGVVGAARLARSCGIERALTLDMGGTSADVARVEGDFTYKFEQRIGDAVVLSPALRIETVAAGGGSICALQASGLAVGPESAGSNPGPACYGAGGPLTLTDVNLLLGRLDPDRTSIPIDRQAAETRLAELVAQLRAKSGAPPDEAGLLSGLLKIAVERMAQAIRQISVAEGYDPKDYALVAFGGAGPQHACAVADLLGIRTILIGHDAGLLSAAGLAAAAVERIAEAQVLEPLMSAAANLSALRDRLAEEAAAAVTASGIDPTVIDTRRVIAEVRLAGQESALAVDVADPHDPGMIAHAFRDEYESVFGYPPEPNRTVEIVSLRCIASSPANPPETEDFGPPDESAGLRILHRPGSTIIAEPGWTVREGSRGTVRLERSEPQAVDANAGAGMDDPIEAELFRNRFHAIVDQMGAALKRTAVSANVKEREDFSCALLDAAGRLVVNAPHIPVHLGALGLCVRTIREGIPLGPGDVAVTNHPAFGGSHLPDVTLVAPVFDDAGELLGYVANRAHHAEIGGIVPGSMPPGARALDEEGAVIAPMLLSRGGRADFRGVQDALTEARFPTRSLADNLADLAAQAAASRRGVRQFELLARQFGSDRTGRALTRLAEMAADAARARLEEAAPESAGAQDILDDGTRITVRISRTGSAPPEWIVDFEGSDAVHAGSFNATPAVVRSAVLYVVRLLVKDDLPLNEGLLEPVRIRLPRCFLNPPFDVGDPAKCPAVVAGNVETSQRIVDCLMSALQLQACSQGTMNNVIFGDAEFGYYETLAGGSGAGPDSDGSGPIHTHMTNTAITDVEVIESRYPVRIEKFAVRRGSGGAGQFQGGDGLVRAYRFLRPVTVSLLTQRRTAGPPGAAGGRSGAPGCNLLRLPARPDEIITLPSAASVDVPAGAVLTIETPGGGGWGEPAASP